MLYVIRALAGFINLRFVCMILWASLSVVKTKPRSHVQIVHDNNNELTVWDDVFQLNELVDLYWVALFNDLEENSNFHIADNTFLDVYIEELNDVLRTSEHI
jgi:hypothetical protein